MNRVIASIMLLCWSFVIFNFPNSDMNSTIMLIYDWYKAFSLPLWSLLTIGLWHDIGREIWHNWLMWDGRKSNKSPILLWGTFSLWMSIIFALVAQVHISLALTPLLALLPVFGWILQDWLVMDWSESPKMTTFQFTSVMIWTVCAYVIYFTLNVGWIVSRVWISEAFGLTFLIN